MLLIHFYTLFALNHDLNELEVFRQIFESPDKFTTAYLPSMPHDEDFETFSNFNRANAGQVKFYQCSNGHLYTIADCKRPATQSFCPTCKDTIGGLSYKLSAGNKEADVLNPKIEHGYLTSTTDENNNAKSHLENIRNMGYLNSSLLRLFLECSLYLASLTNSRHVSAVMQGEQKIAEANLSDYFYKKITSTIDVLATHLQNSPDDSLLFVHFVLSQLHNRSNKNKPKKNVTFKSKEERDKFEQEFCAFINQTVIGNDTVEKLIKNFTNILTEEAKNSNSDFLFRVSHDLVEPSSKPLDSEHLEFLNNRSFWTYRKQITIKSFASNFKSFIQNQTLPLQKDNYKLLDEFLLQLDHLKSIKHLSSIFKMVKMLHSIFNRQMDKQTASNLSLADSIKYNQVLNSNQDMIFSGAKNFLKLWTRLNQSINLKLNSTIVRKFNKSNNLLNGMEANEQVDAKNRFKYLPISYLLPTSYGDGIYIYALIFYLINSQNEFISFYKNIKNSNEPSDQIDLDTITDNDCLHVSIKKDFLNIIFLNSNYTLEHVKELNFEFNFAKIQENIESKFLTDKKMIDSAVFILYFN